MADSPRLAVFAGSFDPITNGHVDLIQRAAALFDRLIVAVLANADKRPLFGVDERMEMIRGAVGHLPRVEVETFGGLLADFVRRRGATAVIRGLRTATEFSDEWQMALMNRHLYSGCETVFLLPSAEFTHISSRLVREIASLGGSLDGLVPPDIAARVSASIIRKSTTGDD
jgi:pantetheine-phosphate adenylyltransferase